MMTAILLVLLILLIVSLGLALGTIGRLAIDWFDRRPPSKADLIKAVRKADAEVEDAQRQAIRDMNDAAGQSWRNIIE